MSKDLTRAAILDAAKSIVCLHREDDYGSPEDNFAVIAEMWEAYIRQKRASPDAEITIEPWDIAAMMCLLKIARIASGNPNCDNWIDLAGYAACGGELEC